MPIERATYPGFFGGVLTSTNIDNNPFEKTNFLPGHSKVEVDFKNTELFGDKIDPLCMGVSCSARSWIDTYCTVCMYVDFFFGMRARARRRYSGVTVALHDVTQL